MTTSSNEKGGPRRPTTTNNTKQSAQQHAPVPPPAAKGFLAEPDPQQNQNDDAWSPDYEEFGDGTSDEVATALALKSFSLPLVWH